MAKRYNLQFSMKPDEEGNPTPGEWNNIYWGVLIDDHKSKIPGTLSAIIQQSAGKDDQGNYINDDVDFIQFQSGKKLVLKGRYCKALPVKSKGGKQSGDASFKPEDFNE